MKRYPTLQPLSRDHHWLLMVCRDGRWWAAGDRRGPTEAELVERVEEILPLLWRHLELEERVLWPACRPFLDESIGLAALEAEHEELRRRLPEAVAAQDGAGLVAVLKMLHDHIRTEERVLFEAIQGCVPNEVLDSFSFE